jgi:hypothetical protein
MCVQVTKTANRFEISSLLEIEASQVVLNFCRTVYKDQTWISQEKKLMSSFKVKNLYIWCFLDKISRTNFSSFSAEFFFQLSFCECHIKQLLTVLLRFNCVNNVKLQAIFTVFMDVLYRINVTQIWNAESTETQIITLSSNKFTSH